jgi:hypothetical protein
VVRFEELKDVVELVLEKSILLLGAGLHRQKLRKLQEESEEVLGAVDCAGRVADPEKSVGLNTLLVVKEQLYDQ